MNSNTIPLWMLLTLMSSMVCIEAKINLSRAAQETAIQRQGSQNRHNNLPPYHKDSSPLKIFTLDTLEETLKQRSKEASEQINKLLEKYNKTLDRDEKKLKMEMDASPHKPDQLSLHNKDVSDLEKNRAHKLSTLRSRVMQHDLIILGGIMLFCFMQIKKHQDLQEEFFEEEEEEADEENEEEADEEEANKEEEEEEEEANKEETVPQDE